MHRLAEIAITNFRSCRDMTLALDDCTPIIGYNNAGKSNIIRAIKRLFPEPIMIGAMEDAAEDSTKSKAGTTIGKLLAECTAPVEQAHGADIQRDLHQSDSA